MHESVIIGVNYAIILSGSLGTDWMPTILRCVMNFALATGVEDFKQLRIESPSTQVAAILHKSLEDVGIKYRLPSIAIICFVPIMVTLQMR